jgi:hypothetical protein
VPISGLAQEFLRAPLAECFKISYNDMTPFVTNLIAVSLIILLLVIIVDLLRGSKLMALYQLLGLGIFLWILHVASDFPHARVPFGDVEHVSMILLLYGCTVAGMIAGYFFYLRGTFRWRGFLRPILVSPIIFLPLVGLVSTSDEKTQITQSISLCILAFQSGFFWKVVFARAEKNASKP